MRTLFLISCLLISANVFGQALKRDTFYTDASKKKLIMHSTPIDSNRSYVTINDKIYTGLLDSLNTDSITEFRVMKPADATILFGKKGKNGAILITMKAPKVPDNDIVEFPPPKKHVTDYILDGEPSNEKEINALDPHRILGITVLKNDKKSVVEELRGKTTLIAITRNFAIKQYQKKLSGLLPDYKTYLDNHHQDDSDLLFIIDKEKYAKLTDDRIKKLYELFAGDKIYQNFSLKYIVGYDQIPSAVELNTK